MSVSHFRAPRTASPERATALRRHHVVLVIQQHELRNNVAPVLGRAEGRQQFTITVAP
jgi:hypothetical protein